MKAKLLKSVAVKYQFLCAKVQLILVLPHFRLVPPHFWLEPPHNSVALATAMLKAKQSCCFFDNAVTIKNMLAGKK